MQIQPIFESPINLQPFRVVKGMKTIIGHFTEQQCGEKEGRDMKRFAAVAIAALCILGASGCTSERYATHARGSPQDSLAMMTKEDVIALTKAGLGNDVIIKLISTTGSTFRLRTPDVITLADSGVADTVIHAMLQADGLSRREEQRMVNRYYPPDYYWWAGDPYYDPWYWSGYYGWPGPYYGARVYSGFHWGGRHR
jgi:hypothetical protein